MLIGNLLNKDLFLRIAEYVKEDCVKIIKELTGDALDFGQLHVSASLLAHATMLPAIKMIPRERAVLDDALCDDLQRLVRDFTSSALGAYYIEGAEKTAETFKSMGYVDQLAVWQLEFILKCGRRNDDEEKALRMIPHLVSWARNYSKELSRTLIEEAKVPSMSPGEGELPFDSIKGQVSTSDGSDTVDDRAESAQQRRRRGKQK